MAKRPTKNGGCKPTEPWQQYWPATIDLRTWMECMIGKADFIDEIRERNHLVQLAVSELAQLGFVAEALAHVERFISRLPRDEASALTSMLDTGAEICLNNTNFELMSAYLNRILEAQPLFKRKCDRGCCVELVRMFKYSHDLLDPADAVDEQGRIEIAFKAARRLAKEALAAGDIDRVRKHLADAEAYVPAFAGHDAQWAIKTIVMLYGMAGDTAQLQRWFQRLDQNPEECSLDAHDFMQLGDRRRALARAHMEIERAMKRLADPSDPNVHYPASTLKRNILFLHEIGEKEAARRALENVLTQGRMWNLSGRDFATAAALRDVALVAAKIDRPDAGLKLLDVANEHAHAEIHAAWKRNATSETVMVLAEIGFPEDAIALAYQLRSPKGRRSTLAKLLARQGRWEELHKTLSQAATPKEAAELCWAIRFA